MTRDFHDDRFRDSGLSHVRIEAMAGVMENKPPFRSPAVWYPGNTTSLP